MHGEGEAFADLYSDIVARTHSGKVHLFADLDLFDGSIGKLKGYLALPRRPRC
jgi:hypothetical protein